MHVDVWVAVLVLWVCVSMINEVSVFPWWTQGPVSVKVMIPNVSDKPEWNLNGQTLEFTLPLTDTVSAFTCKLSATHAQSLVCGENGWIWFYSLLISCPQEKWLNMMLLTLSLLSVGIMFECDALGPYVQTAKKVNFFPTHWTLWDDRKFVLSHRISHWWTISTASFVDVSHTGVWH